MMKGTTIAGGSVENSCKALIKFSMPRLYEDRSRIMPGKRPFWLSDAAGEAIEPYLPQGTPGKTARG